VVTPPPQEPASPLRGAGDPTATNPGTADPPPQAVPEPGSMSVLITGSGSVILIARKRRQSSMRHRKLAADASKPTSPAGSA
jgi:hypothetical protein